MCQRHGVAGALPACGRLHALIEDHHDVRAQRDLHGHRVLRRKEVFAAVEVRLKLHALRRDLAHLREREDLKAARVSEHGPRPAHEAMDAAGAANHLMPGAQIQVVRVGEDDLRAERLHHALLHGLDGRSCTDGHKDRRLHGAVRQRENAATAARRRGVFGLKGERHSGSL